MWALAGPGGPSLELIDVCTCVCLSAVCVLTVRSSEACEECIPLSAFASSLSSSLWLRARLARHILLASATRQPPGACCQMCAYQPSLVQLHRGSSRY